MAEIISNENLLYIGIQQSILSPPQKKNWKK